MASSKFTRIVFVLLLVKLAIASPLVESAPISTEIESQKAAQETPGVLEPASHVEDEIVVPDNETEPDPTASKEARQLLQMATLIPAEALKALRAIAVPLFNSTLLVPENILKQASQLPVSNVPKVRAQLADPSLREKIFTPVEDFFRVAAERTRAAIPTALDRVHLRRHIANFRHYLAARQDILRNVTMGLDGWQKVLDDPTPAKTDAADTPIEGSTAEETQSEKVSVPVESDESSSETDIS